MKKIIMLLMVSFSFALVNAQGTTKAKAKTETKSCSKECTKSCCTAKAKAECTKSKAECTKSKAECTKSKAECSKSKAECSKSKAECTKSKAECSKAKAKGKSCEKSAKAKACCDKSKTGQKHCSGSSAAAVKTINAKDFVTYAKRFPAENVLDLRARKVVKATGMIEGAVNLDYNSRDFKEKVNNLDKDAAVMIYSDSGKTSQEAIALFKSWGFKKIFNLEGGFKAYKAAFPKK